MSLMLHLILVVFGSLLLTHGGCDAERDFNSPMMMTALGQPCDSNEECLESVPNSWCFYSTQPYKVCLCYFTHVPSADNSQCLARAGIGEPCLEPAQCVVEHSTCGAGQTCVCTPDYLPSHDSSKCLRKADLLGESCEADEQCEAHLGRFSECSSGNIKICRCEVGSSPTQDFRGCVKPTSLIGEGCETNEHCPGIPLVTSECSPSTKTCECLQGYVASKNLDSCLIIRHQLNETCAENEQCSSGLLGSDTNCMDGFCQCEDGYPLVGGTCRKPPSLGELCRSDEDCERVTKNSYCAANEPTRDFRCKCTPAAVETPDHTSCYLRKIGSWCDTSEDCTRAISGEVECDPCDYFCNCKAGHTPSRNMSSCYPNVECVTKRRLSQDYDVIFQ